MNLNREHHIALIARESYAMGLAVALRSLLDGVGELHTAADLAAGAATGAQTCTAPCWDLEFRPQHLHIWLLNVELTAATLSKFKEWLTVTTPAAVHQVGT